MDVTTAYLNGDLTEEIYMEQPECFIKEANKVCRLKRSLYGLRQSGREWNKKLDSKLLGMKFTRCFSDECVYIKRQNSGVIIITIYVDDIILAASSETLMDQVKSELKTLFKMKDEGPIHYCLGINIKQYTDGNIYMNQRKYISDILKRFDMSECKPVSSPLDPNKKLKACEENGVPVDSELYQSIIGSLMYLATSTRPDISYAVSALSQFNSRPTHEHFVAAKRVIRYIKGTSNYNLKFESKGTPLQGFTDADWGGDINDRKSYTGFVFVLAGGAVSWQSRKQKSIALSSTEAEYMSLTQAAKEGVYLRNFLKELEMNNLTEKITIFSDNQSAIKLVKNNVHHSRTKHIDIQHHFVREVYEQGFVDISYVPSENMIADIFTKSLFRNKHSNCLRHFGLSECNIEGEC